MLLLPTEKARPKRTPWEIERSVLFALFQRELKGRLGGRWLGAIRLFFEPIAHLTVMMLIWTYVRHRIVPGMTVPLFLTTGLIPFIVFRKLSIQGMRAIDSNRGLFGYRQVKPLDTLAARVLLESLIYGVVYVCFLAFLGWLGDQWLPDRPLELMLTILILIVFGAGFGLVLIVLTDDLPQLRILVRVAFMPVYLLSGVIFPVRTLPPEIIDWLAWNPLLHLMEFCRAFFSTQYPAIPQATLGYPAASALVMVALGLALYRVRRNRILAR